MATKKYILVSHFCKHAHIEKDFVENLHEYGLLSIEKLENDLFIHRRDISEIEKMFRLHTDLGINFEGLDAISEMLKRIGTLEKNILKLQKRLDIYE